MSGRRLRRPPRRGPTGRLRSRLIAMLYADERLTLHDVGEIFGVSRQAIHQHLKCAGLLSPGDGRAGRSGRPRTVFAWQVELVRRLESYGLSRADATEVVDISRTACDRRLGPPRDKYTGLNGGAPCRTGPGRRAWQEAADATVAAAWLDGATLKDLAEIMRSTPEGAAARIHRLRANGYNLPRRGPGVRALRRGAA